MADKKLSELTELAATPANDDELYVRDVSEAAADESKRITVTNLMAAAPAGTFELIGENNPSGAAYTEFTGLSGTLFLLYYVLHTSDTTELLLRLNGVDSADYSYRFFDTGTAVASSTGETSILVAESQRQNIGVLMISGKQGVTYTGLNVGHYGGIREESADLLINARLEVAADLSSIRLYPAAGTITGFAKLFKVE